MVSVQRTLIDIASASHRVIDASVAYARVKNDRNVDMSRTRLGGELHRVVAASGTILKETLQHDYGASCNDPAFDDRLTNWLSSDEPQACLDSLNAMEMTIKSSSNRVASTFHSPFRSSPSEDRIREAMRIFEKRRDFFHFLLTTDVWNHETIAMGQSRVGSLHTTSTLTKQGVGFANWNASVTTTLSAWPEKSNLTRWEVDQRQLSEISRWLDAWDCMAKHEDTLDLRQPDTCTWLLDTDEYITWRSANDSFLWLHGKPGSGKSVLAASVVDSLERTLHEGELLAFFYCDFRSERTTAAAEVMRSILFQLVRGFDNLGVDPGGVLDSLGKEKRRNGSILTRANRLAPMVSRAAKQFTRQPLVVIDALDECYDVENLLDALLVLTQGGMRLFVISRPLQVIKDGFSGLTWLSLENMWREVSADIKLHVTRELDSHRRLRVADATLKKVITRTLCTKADGMFRWIQCQLDTLKRCLTTVEFREALESLPIGLEATYEQILLSLNKEERGGQIARRALVWLVAALEPLLLCQIVEVLSIDLGRRILNPDAAPIHGHALLDTLGSLVTHDEETDIVILSHFSVKEYLVGAFSQKKCSYHINEQDAHAQVAQQCMTYMAACIKLEQGFSEESHPLLHYVTSRGFVHLAHARPDRVILNAITALHSDVQQHPSQWELMCEGAAFYHPYPCLPGLEHDFVLYILIGYAPESFLRLFLGNGPLRAKKGTNPLIYTAKNKVEHARTLLSRGAKLDLPGMFIYTYWWDRTLKTGLPIEAAIGEGDRALVDLFIAEGSPVPHKPFSAAFFAGGRCTIRAHVVARLLQTNEFVEWVTNVEDKAPLLRVLDHSHYYEWGQPIEEDVVVMTRRLGQIGLDLSGRNSFIEMLLRHAAFAGHISTVEHFLVQFNVPLPSDIFLDASRNERSNRTMIRFLIQNGANVHAISPDENSALHYTMRRCKEKNCLERVKILCEAGCNPSACNLDCETPVHLAAMRGYISVVKYLLSVGALLPADILPRAVSDSDSYIAPNSSMVRFLLAEGANACAVAANGDTVLHAFLQSSCSDVSYSGDWHDCLELTRMLVAAGCDLDIPNLAGETPVTLAVRTGRIPIVKYFLSLQTPFPPDILLTASRANRLPMIKFLLTMSVDIHITSPDGHNALHYAVTWTGDTGSRDGDGCLQTVKTLVDAGCSPFAHTSNGESLLHIATRYGWFQVIQYLFSQGLPLPSDILLFASYDKNNSQIIRFLIDKGADVHAVAANGGTPLHFAVMSYDESLALDFVKILIDAGSDPSAVNSSSKTPLYGAVFRGHISVINYLLSLHVPLPPDILLTASASRSMTISPIIRLLIDKGADATIVTTKGDTALHLAVAPRLYQDDRFEAIKILIGAGCDIHARNSAGEAPLYAAARGGHITVIEYLLSLGALLPPDIFLAAASCVDNQKRVPIIRFLATLDGANVHVIALNGDTVLHRAVASWNDYDCLESTKILIGLGCSPLLLNSVGETPLHISARRGHIAVTKYLLSLGMSLPSDVLFSASLGISWYMAPMMRFLIREGADPCVINGSGDTPLHVILRHSDIRNSTREWELIQILLDRGCNPNTRNLDGQTPIDLAQTKGSFFAQNFMRLVRNAQRVHDHVRDLNAVLD